MAKNKRLSPNQLAQEKSYFANLKQIQNYQPARTEFSVTAIQTVTDELDNLLEEEAKALAKLSDVRDRIAEKGRLFVEKNDGAVVQVAAQFGEDSPEYQSLGRKRKSERGTRRRQTRSDNQPPTG